MPPVRTLGAAPNLSLRDRRTSPFPLLIPLLAHVPCSKSTSRQFPQMPNAQLEPLFLPRVFSPPVLTYNYPLGLSCGPSFHGPSSTKPKLSSRGVAPSPGFPSPRYNYLGSAIVNLTTSVNHSKTCPSHGHRSRVLSLPYTPPVGKHHLILYHHKTLTVPASRYPDAQQKPFPDWLLHPAPPSRIASTRAPPHHSPMRISSSQIFPSQPLPSFQQTSQPKL